MASYAYVDISATIGALQIGCLFGIFLFGVVSLQTYNYYDTYGDDPWTTKLLTLLTHFPRRALEAGHTVGVSFDVYRSTITFYGRPDMLGRFEGIWAVIICGGGRHGGWLNNPESKAYFASRLTKLFPSPYKYLGNACIVISFLRFCASVYLTVVGHTASSLGIYVAKVGWLIATTFIVSASLDVIIAASMLYFLAKKRADGTNSRDAIEGSGLLTSSGAGHMPQDSAKKSLNARRRMREEVLKDSFFGRRKTSVLESTSYFRDRDLPASPASSVGPITGIEMNGNPELYYNKAKLQPITNLSIYRISESEEEA
ncbi:hypothetical protein CVT26_005878 [Gymnopilus dilepis]|uniref:Uncharacterized protein n=1 Tax=Gymnopilus dilepis TaxID=231916 RepID=A0A409WBU7_9AGAR|nr:hypothetical protein CVT26_005878 [Gymnopilus dilepis]